MDSVWIVHGNKIKNHESIVVIFYLFLKSGGNTFRSHLRVINHLAEVIIKSLYFHYKLHET